MLCTVHDVMYDMHVTHVVLQVSLSLSLYIYIYIYILQYIDIMCVR